MSAEKFETYTARMTETVRKASEVLPPVDAAAGAVAAGMFLMLETQGKAVTAQWIRELVDTVLAGAPDETTN
jgi:hypothetical protein